MIRSLVLLASILFLLVNTARAEEPTPEVKKKIEELNKQLAEKRLEVAKIEAELAKLQPVEVVKFLYANSLKVGTAGPFGSGFNQGGRDLGPSTVDTFKVVKVVDEKRAIVKVLVFSEVKKGVANHTFAEIIFVTPTKGLADGAALTPEAKSFRVVGTEKHDDKTYFVVEPHSSK